MYVPIVLINKNIIKNKPETETLLIKNQKSYYHFEMFTCL